MTKPMFFRDSYIMFRRCLTKAMRSPESMTMALVVPIVMLVLFGYVFGGIVDLGEINYLNFIVPGIIVQCIMSGSQYTALGLQADMHTGIIDRFRSMAIAKSAVISGHVWVSVLRSIIVTAVIIGASFLMGFRPEASATDWLLAVILLVVFIIAITWLMVIVGIISNDAESASGAGFLFTIFVFISSAFSPTENLPTVLRIFAENQPLTHVINALRNLMLGFPMDGEFLTAMLWCAGITVVGFIVSVQIYKAKLTR